MRYPALGKAIVFDAGKISVAITIWRSVTAAASRRIHETVEG